MNDSLLATKSGIILLIVEVLLVATIVYLGAKTALLRDSDPKEPDFKKRSYSMAKSQLAFWMIVVMGCFIYVYVTTEQFTDVLNNTALILLGISSGTTALSGVAGGAPTTAVPGGDGAAAADQDHPAPSPGHKNFLDDILSDSEGKNVHRLQMLLWTVILGGIFVHQVAKTGIFPEFGEQHYFLMGISSATYVWFKRTEK